jgi:hypothetical protein
VLVLALLNKNKTNKQETKTNKQTKNKDDPGNRNLCKGHALDAGRGRIYNCHCLLVSLFGKRPRRRRRRFGHFWTIMVDYVRLFLNKNLTPEVFV